LGQGSFSAFLALPAIGLSAMPRVPWPACRPVGFWNSGRSQRIRPRFSSSPLGVQGDQSAEDFRVRQSLPRPAVHPGLAERIVVMAERQLEHRVAMEKAQRTNVTRSKRMQKSGGVHGIFRS
jgi:hypothetical protein